jgi:hypothetical protein
MLNNLRRPGGHRQDDRFELVAHALGGFVGRKLANGDYRTPQYAYYRHSVSHNTVAVGREGQWPPKDVRYQNEEGTGGGELAFFADLNHVKVVSARSHDCYPGYSVQRTVVLVGDRYIVDFFHVAGDTPTEIDWVWHCQGTLDRPGHAVPATLQGGEGYEFVEDVATVRNDHAWQATWVLHKPDKGLRRGAITNPYEDTVDWESSTADFILRVKRDGQRVRVYRTNLGNPHPSPVASPVFASLFNPNMEYPIDGQRNEASENQPPEAPAQHGLFTLTMAGEEGTEVYFGNAPGPDGWRPFDPMTPLVLVRRHAASTTFMTALDAYRHKPNVLSVEAVLNGPGASAIKVKTAGSEDTLVVNYGLGPVDTDGLYLDGQFAAFSVQDGKPMWAAVVNGSTLRTRELAIERGSRGTFEQAH